MKKHLTGFLLGICATVLAMTLVVPAFADGEFDFNRVIISVNGEQKAGLTENYTLDDGTQVPFSILYQQTTYMPMRKLSELMGFVINWNGNTNTVELTTENGEVVGIEFYQRALAKNNELQQEVNRLLDENSNLKQLLIMYGAFAPATPTPVP